MIQTADNTGIRFYRADQVTAADPQDDVPGAWSVSSPQTAQDYSAVAYFFARKLNREISVPVGIVQTPWGGKPVEAYTHGGAFEHP